MLIGTMVAKDALLQANKADNIEIFFIFNIKPP
jgi:hypothetical protein